MFINIRIRLNCRYVLPACLCVSCVQFPSNTLSHAPPITRCPILDGALRREPGRWAAFPDRQRGAGGAGPGLAAYRQPTAPFKILFARSGLACTGAAPWAYRSSKWARKGNDRLEIPLGLISAPATVNWTRFHFGSVWSHRGIKRYPSSCKPKNCKLLHHKSCR